LTLNLANSAPYPRFLAKTILFALAEQINYLGS